MSIKGYGLNFSLFQIFGKGPKWTFQCDCGYDWKQRMVVGVNYPLIVCPCCKHSERLNVKWGPLSEI